MILKFIIHIQLRLKISQEMHDVSVDKILIVGLIITVTSMSITKTKVVMFKSYTCIFYLEFHWKNILILLLFSNLSEFNMTTNLKVRQQSANRKTFISLALLWKKRYRNKCQRTDKSSKRQDSRQSARNTNKEW